MTSKIIVEGNSQLLICTACRSIFGHQVWVDGRMVLRIKDDLELYRLHGWHTCTEGERIQVHWDSSDVVRNRAEKAVKLANECR